MKPEATSTMKKNDFMLDTSFGEETMEELTAAVSEVIQLVLWIVDSGCSKHMTGNLQLLRNFIKKFIGIVRFGNDHFAAITGYEDYGDDLLTGSCDSNLYTISISEMAASSIVCFMSRATSTKSWLWHRRLSHLNFAYEQGKSKKVSLPPKLVPSTESKLEQLHIDLCGPMRVANSSEDSQSVPSKTDLDNLFGPLYEEYYATSSPEVLDNSAANTLDNENTSSSLSIVVEEDKAPQIVSSSTKPVVTEPYSPVLNENADELVQEDITEFDGNVFYNPPQTPMFEEAESSSTF
ncbi:retrovirus-related pol polyprotein from transposon TNT 1-94 [Tanacetum coccineum]